MENHTVLFLYHFSITIMCLYHLLQGYDVKKQIFNIYFTMFLYMTSNVLLMIPEMMRSQIYQCAEIEKHVNIIWYRFYVIV